jgi:O-antigen ligase
VLADDLISNFWIDRWRALRGGTPDEQTDVSRRSVSLLARTGHDRLMIIVILALLAAALALTGVFGARRATLALIAIRPACDKTFDAIKGLAGSSNGPGATFNLLVIALAALAILRRPQALLAPPVIAWGFVLLAAAASLLHSPDPAAGMRLLLTLVTYGAVLALPFALIDTIADAMDCLKAALASSVIPVGVGIIELLSTPAILLDDERLESTFTHPNILAFYLVGVLTLILFLMASRMASLSSRQSRGLMAYACLLVILLLATKTRSAWIAMVLILGGHALANDRRWLWAIAALPLLVLIPGVGDRILDLGGGNTNDAFANLNSYAWRQLLWSETYEWLRQNPALVFGHGLDLYVSYVPLFFSRGANPEGVGAHNAALQIYFEMGLTGIAAFAGVFITLFIQLAKRMDVDFPGAILFTLLCASHVLVANSDNMLDYLQFQWFFWFTVGTVVASTPLLRRTQFQSMQPASKQQSSTPARA